MIEVNETVYFRAHRGNRPRGMEGKVIDSEVRSNGKKETTFYQVQWSEKDISWEPKSRLLHEKPNDEVNIIEPVSDEETNIRLTKNRFVQHGRYRVKF